MVKTVVLVTGMVTAARDNDGVAMTREEEEGGVDFLFFPLQPLVSTILHDRLR